MRKAGEHPSSRSEVVPGHPDHHLDWRCGCKPRQQSQCTAASPWLTGGCVQDGLLAGRRGRAPCPCLEQEQVHIIPRRVLYPSVSLRADCLSKDGLMCCSAILELFQTGCSCVSPLGSTITKKGQVLTSLGSSREVIRMRECTVAGTPQPARICGSSLSLDLLLLQHKS